MSESIVIVGAARTPLGSFQGDFSSLSVHDLGGAAIKAAVERAGIASNSVGEVLYGNCLTAGRGQAPARQAATGAACPTARAVTLIHALKARGKTRGVATLCIGGGEGTAVAIELI